MFILNMLHYSVVNPLLLFIQGSKVNLLESINADLQLIHWEESSVQRTRFIVKLIDPYGQLRDLLKALIGPLSVDHLPVGVHELDGGNRIEKRIKTTIQSQHFVVVDTCQLHQVKSPECTS